MATEEEMDGWTLAALTTDKAPRPSPWCLPETLQGIGRPAMSDVRLGICAMCFREGRLGGDESVKADGNVIF